MNRLGPYIKLRDRRSRAGIVALRRTPDGPGLPVDVLAAKIQRPRDRFIRAAYP
jgi:hypothetical protein